MYLRIFITTAVICTAALFSPAAVSAGPQGQIEQTVGSIIDVLQKGKAVGAERRGKVRRIINDSFDFDVMSQRVLATNWKKASAGEKERFTALFARLLEATYMERIEAYTDEKVKYVKEKIKGNQAQVDTLIIAKNVEIPINYRVHLSGEKWLVYDVVIEEVSLVRNYRSSYKDIVRKHGIPGLLQRLEEKVKKMDQGPHGKKS